MEKNELISTLSGEQRRVRQACKMQQEEEEEDCGMNSDNEDLSRGEEGKRRREQRERKINT